MLYVDASGLLLTPHVPERLDYQGITWVVSWERLGLMWGCYDVGKCSLRSTPRSHTNNGTCTPSTPPAHSPPPPPLPTREYPSRA